MCVSEWGQGLTFTKNVGQGFLFYSTPPAQRTVYQPQQVKVSSKGVEYVTEEHCKLKVTLSKWLRYMLSVFQKCPPHAECIELHNIPHQNIPAELSC